MNPVEQPFCDRVRVLCPYRPLLLYLYQHYLFTHYLSEDYFPKGHRFMYGTNKVDLKYCRNKDWAFGFGVCSTCGGGWRAYGVRRAQSRNIISHIPPAISCLNCSRA